MKRKSTFLLMMGLLLGVVSAQVNAGPPLAQPLTEEELKPFCNNELIWKPHNVSAQRCLEVATQCSQEIAQKQVDILKANNLLYTCTFDKLGIH